MDHVARKLTIAAFALLAPCLAGVGYAEAASPALTNLTPFRPTSLVNDQPALCDPFLAGWTAAFDGGGALDEDGVDLAAIYPQAQHFEMAGLDRASHDELSSFNIAVDLDGDGEDEVLWFRADHLGWRYRGVSLYLFDSIADFERKDDANLKALQEIHRYGPIKRARVLKIDGRYYTLDGPTAARWGSVSGLAVSLFEIQPSEPARAVCTVALFPEAPAFAEVIDTTPLFQAARDLYAGPSQCVGSSGWTPPSFDFALPTILYRPWVLKPEDTEKRRRADISREIAYLNWGISDPQSWRDYLEVKASRKSFISDMAAYYRATDLAASKAEAKDLAERAWRFVLDTLFYNSYGYDLVRRGQDHLPISPDSPPETITRLLIAWLGEQREASSGSWPGDALLAAIYTRQQQETIHAIAQSIEGAFEADLAKMRALPAERREATLAHQKKFWAQTLIAALGHNELTGYFLDRADPNLGTNGFGKTALMYAAQHDRLNAVKLLLAHGVEIDAITDATKVRGSCDRLDRDHRTALMYAAENASAKLIDALLDAGADIAAADTKNNTSLWYFSRNTTVTSASERARLIKRLGGER